MAQQIKQGETFQSLQAIRQCLSNIQQELMWLKEVTPSNKSKDFANEATARFDKAMRRVQKAYARHETKAQLEDVGQEQEQSKEKTNKPYKVQRPEYSNS